MATAPRGGKAGGRRRSGSQETCLPRGTGIDARTGEMDVQLRVRREDGRDLPLLLWRFPTPMRAIASAPHGGGLSVRRWVVNAQVPQSYRRRDPDHHLGKLGVSL